LEPVEGSASLREERPRFAGTTLGDKPFAVVEQCDGDVERGRELSEKLDCLSQSRPDVLRLTAAGFGERLDPEKLRVEEWRWACADCLAPVFDDFRQVVDVVEAERVSVQRVTEW
jgi:hypothetical protein